MGKYQLDYKGMQQVERFHEKHSNVKTDKKARVSQLKAQFLEKAKKKSKYRYRLCNYEDLNYQIKQLLLT